MDNSDECGSDFAQVHTNDIIGGQSPGFCEDQEAPAAGFFSSRASDHWGVLLLPSTGGIVREQILGYGLVEFVAILHTHSPLARLLCTEHGLAAARDSPMLTVRRTALTILCTHDSDGFLGFESHAVPV